MLISTHKPTLWLLITVLILGWTPAVFAKNKVQLLAEISHERRHAPQQQLQTLIENEALLPELTHQQQLAYFNKKALLYIDLALYKEAKQTAEQGLSLAELGAIPPAIHCEMLMSVGFSEESLGDMVAAERYYNEALRIARLHNEPGMIAQSLINLGALAYLAYENTKSLSLLTEALAIAEQLNNPVTLGMVYSELSILHNNLRQPDEVVKYSQKALTEYKKTDNQTAILNEMSNLASAYTWVDKITESKQLYQDMLAKSRQVKNEQYQYYALIGLFGNALAEENFELALTYLQQAEPYVETMQHATQPGYFYTNKAYVQLQLEQYDNVLTNIEKAKAILTTDSIQIALNYDGIYLDSLKADALFGLGRYQEALALKKQYALDYVETREKEWRQNTEETRVKFVSEKAKAQQQLLQQQQDIQQVALAKASIASKKRTIELAVVAVLALIVGVVLIQQLKNQKRFRQLANTDELTGLLNRRRVHSLGRKMVDDAITLQQPVVVFVMDIDRFKAINDTYGHKVGDEVIQTVAKESLANLRKRDVFGRVGGEEFVGVLPNTSVNQAFEIIERCRTKLAQISQFSGEESFSITASFGVAGLDKVTSSFEALLHQADKALYQAKNSGRNQTIIANGAG